MKLIERYVREVGRHLPRRLRGDVERELLSTLEDALEARGQKIEGTSGDDAELAILADFGPPEKMAASYRRGPSAKATDADGSFRVPNTTPWVS